MSMKTTKTNNATQATEPLAVRSNDQLGLVPERDDGLVWAPADGVQMLLERAASMLTGYGELIRRDGCSHVEEHHYLPEVEHVAAELRELVDARDEIRRMRGEGDVMRTWINAALVPLQAVADLEDFEDGGEGMNALIAAGRALVA